MASTRSTAQIVTILIIAATTTATATKATTPAVAGGEATKLQQQDFPSVALKTTQSFRDNCACETDWNCRCCARFNNDFFNIYQNLCANWNVLPESWEVHAHITLNNATVFSNKFSGNDIPPLCFPLVAALPLFGCIKVHSLAPHANNKLHACANATLSFATFTLLNFQLACADIGPDGIQLVEREHDELGGDGGGTTTEAGPEISLETSDALPPTTSSTAQPEIAQMKSAKYLNLWKLNEVI